MDIEGASPVDSNPKSKQLLNNTTTQADEMLKTSKGSSWDGWGGSSDKTPTMALRRRSGNTSNRSKLNSRNGTNENDFDLQFGVEALNIAEQESSKPRLRTTHRSRPVTMHRDNRMVEYEPCNTLVSPSYFISGIEMASVVIYACIFSRRTEQCETLAWLQSTWSARKGRRKKNVCNQRRKRVLEPFGREGIRIIIRQITQLLDMGLKVMQYEKDLGLLQVGTKEERTNNLQWPRLCGTKFLMQVWIMRRVQQYQRNNDNMLIIQGEETGTLFHLQIC